MRTSSSAIKPIATPALAGRYRRTRKRGDGGETGVSDTEDHPERRPDRVCLRAHPGKATAARPPLVVALNRKLDPPRAGNWGQSFSSRRSSAWLEQRSFKPRVRGSNPRAGTNRVSDYASLYPTMRMERSNSASVYPTALVAMYTAVLKRTREIGTMKALGARSADVRGMFMSEAGMIGLLGGAAGLLIAAAVGVASNAMVTAIARQQGMPLDLSRFRLNWWLVAGAVALATLYTALSGSFPALRAG